MPQIFIISFSEPLYYLNGLSNLREFFNYFHPRDLIRCIFSTGSTDDFDRLYYEIQYRLYYANVEFHDEMLDLSIELITEILDKYLTDMIEDLDVSSLKFLRWISEDEAMLVHENIN